MWGHGEGVGGIKYNTVDDSVVKPKVVGAGFLSVELEPQIADCWPGGGGGPLK